MASGAAHSFSSTPMHRISICTCALLLIFFLHASPALGIIPPIQDISHTWTSTLATGKSCADSLLASARHDNEMQWVPRSIHSYEAGQIDVALLLLLLVAWGIASVRLYGSDREK